MVVAITLTSGRIAAAEQEALRRIDDVVTRAIIVRAEPNSGLTPAVLERLRPVVGVAWAGAFSPFVDGRNAVLPGAANVPVRHLYSTDPGLVSVPDVIADHTAYLSPAGAAALRMPYAAGAPARSSSACCSSRRRGWPRPGSPWGRSRPTWR